MFEKLIEQIEAHPRYAPAMRNAVDRRLPLALNYHTHQGIGTWCVSICTRVGTPVMFMEDQTAMLEELVHIRDFGRERGDCVRLTATLADELARHYGMEEKPELWLEGNPLSST
jgi:hypothetical protein